MRVFGATTGWWECLLEEDRKLELDLTPRSEHSLEMARAFLMLFLVELTSHITATVNNYLLAHFGDPTNTMNHLL